MNRNTASFLRCIAIASGLVLAASAQAPATLDLARIEQVIQSHKDFMGTVLVARGSDVLFNKGYGSANLEWAIPNAPSVKFRLGSVTKQFTAASILLLEERGKLNINDPVKKYMPDAPAAWDKVTIFHLLTHTSGIPSFTGFPDYPSSEATPTTPEKLVARFRDKPLEFQPGEKWNYSNSGYVLLGLSARKDQRPDLQRLCAAEHLQAAGDERFGLRLELGDHPASRLRLCARPPRPAQCQATFT